MRIPKSFGVCELYLLIFTIWEIKNNIDFKSFQNKSLYVSIINIFYEKITIFLRMKTWVRGGAPLYIFASLLSCLIEDSWFSDILLHSMYGDTFLAQADEENLASPSYVVRKRQSILTAFPDNYRYDSLITTLTMSSF